MRLAPSSLRHLVCADIISLNAMARPVLRLRQPLVGHALDVLRDYLSKLESPSPESPLFPKYGRDGGMEAVSQLLNGVIRKRLKISDKNLVAYSARHTMKDKLRALRAPQDVQHRILGHGSKSQADGYGAGNPLTHLQEVLIEADNLGQWGLL